MTEKNSKAIGDVCIFTEEESNAIAKEVLSARDKWIKRGPSLSRYFHVFYSLGAASSTDAANSLEEYQRLACRKNPWFDQHLPWVYNTIEKKLSDEIGSCKVERDLAYPGFHIFHIPRVLRFLPTSLIEKMTKKIKSESLNELGSATFVSDLMAIKHENSVPRIYRT